MVNRNVGESETNYIMTRISEFYSDISSPFYKLHPSLRKPMIK